MSFDLNKPIDFARATNSLVGNQLLQIQNLLDKAKGVRQWVIEEAAFDGIKFHVFKESLDYSAGLSRVEDQGGRRLAVFKLPYVDGQTSDDLGREGYAWSFDAIIHGSNYRAAYKTLKERLENSAIPGDLIHPVNGRVRARPRSWSFVHEYQSRQAVLFRVEFIEHNFDIGQIEIRPDEAENTSVFKNALAAALQFVSKIGSVIDRVKAISNLATSVVNTFERDLAEVQLLLKNNLVSLNASFNIDGQTDIPGVLPVTNGGSTTSDPTGESGTASTVNVVTSPNDPFAALRGTTADVPLVTPQQAVDAANVYRARIDQQIQDIQAQDLELELYEDVLTLQASAIALQAAVEAGISSSRPRIKEFVVPFSMSVRMAAFMNGLTPDQGSEIDQLNPSLDSLNWIEKGTVLLIPTPEAG
jgi:hypothetical protein